MTVPICLSLSWKFKEMVSQTILGGVIWDKPVRTGQKDNFATNLGVSATISFPLDGGCMKDVKKQACNSNTNAATTNC